MRSLLLITWLSYRFTKSIDCWLCNNRKDWHAVCCWLRDNAIESWHSTRSLSHIPQHCRRFNAMNVQQSIHFRLSIRHIHCCSEQKLLLPSGLELMSESSESGALSLSSAAPARYIDFHSSRRIYVVLVAHSLALSLHYTQNIWNSGVLALLQKLQAHWLSATGGGAVEDYLFASGLPESEYSDNGNLCTGLGALRL